MSIAFRPRAAAALLGALAPVLLAACSYDSRETLGLVAPPPDEFLVVARRPLELPPDLAALPPPSPGAPSRVEPNPVADAQAALAASDPAAPPAARDVATAAPPSAAEQALVASAGTADPAIRETLAAEPFVPQRRFGLDSLFGIPIVQDPADAARRVQPTEESERLRAEGLPAPTAPPAPPAATN